MLCVMLRGYEVITFQELDGNMYSDADESTNW